MALPVILSILKAAGIVVLILLGIIVLLLLIVLFWPVRWRLKGSKHSEGAELRADASWLFGIVRFRLRYEDGGFPYKVTVFGHQVYPKKEAGQ